MPPHPKPTYRYMVISMVNLIGQNFGGGGQVALGSLPAKPAEIALPLPSVPTALQHVQVQTAHVSDQAIQEAMQEKTKSLKQTIAAVLPRFYSPVGDVRFTIFKDASGQYITKITNIFSGESTQVPEPKILEMISTSGIGAQGNFIQTIA